MGCSAGKRVTCVIAPRPLWHISTVSGVCGWSSTLSQACRTWRQVLSDRMEGTESVSCSCRTVDTPPRTIRSRSSKSGPARRISSMYNVDCAVTASLIDSVHDPVRVCAKGS